MVERITAREAIDQAKKRLVDDRGLNTILNQHKSVRVPVMKSHAHMIRPDEPPTSEPALFVTFTIEETHFGLRLMAEFEGYKEFAA